MDLMLLVTEQTISEKEINEEQIGKVETELKVSITQAAYDNQLAETKNAMNNSVNCLNEHFYTSQTPDRTLSVALLIDLKLWQRLPTNFPAHSSTNGEVEGVVSGAACHSAYLL